MKNAIVTVAIGDSGLWEFTHPLMEEYASRVGADFIKIKGGYEDSLRSRLKKFEIYELFEEYDRVIYLDGDIAVNPECPDLFKLVPYDKIGAVFEKPPYCQDRSGVLQSACEFYGVPFSSSEEYNWFNTGLLVLSRPHRNLFIRPSEVRVFGEGWIDMPLMNALSIKNGYEVYDLGLKYNYMGSLVSHKDRPCEPVDAYIFHATGFLRLYRTEILRLVVGLWDERSRGKRRMMYQLHPVVLSYRMYEGMRSRAAKMRKRFKMSPQMEGQLVAA